MPEQQQQHNQQRHLQPAYAAPHVYPVYGAPTHYPCYPPHVPYGAGSPGAAPHHPHVRYDYVNPVVHRDTIDANNGEVSKNTSETRQEESEREIPMTTTSKEIRVPTNPDSAKKAEKELTSNPQYTINGSLQAPKNPQISTLTVHYPPPTASTTHAHNMHPGWSADASWNQQLPYHPHHHHHYHEPYATTTAVPHKGIPLPPPVPPAGYPVTFPPHAHHHPPARVSYVAYPVLLPHQPPPPPPPSAAHPDPSMSSDSNSFAKDSSSLPAPAEAPKSVVATEEISIGQDTSSSEDSSQEDVESKGEDNLATALSPSKEALSSNTDVQSTMPEAADALLSLAMLRYTPSHRTAPKTVQEEPERPEDSPKRRSTATLESTPTSSTTSPAKRKADDMATLTEENPVHQKMKQNKTVEHSPTSESSPSILQGPDLGNRPSTRVTLPYRKHLGHSPDHARPSVHNASPAPVATQRTLSMEDEGSICTCKKSRCLKLYCDCLGAGAFCSSRCKCLDCGNIPGSKDLLKAAETIKKKMQESKTLKKSRGAVTCKCSKSGCLKKYCECFKGGLFCGVDCVCRDCKNFPGSEEFRMRKLAQLDMEGRKRDKAEVLQSVQQQHKFPPSARKIKDKVALRAAPSKQHHYPEYPSKTHAYPRTLLAKHSSTVASAFRPSPSTGPSESFSEDSTNHKVTPTPTFEKESSSGEAQADPSLPGKVKRALVHASDNIVVSPGSTCSQEPRTIAAAASLHIPK